LDEQKQDPNAPMFVPEDLGSATVIAADKDRQIGEGRRKKRNNLKRKRG
jgi:hypothetical protein